MSKRVLVIGAGVAGLTAAHELAERGYTVTVVEKQPIPGGKARSVDVPGTGDSSHRPLPGEHGFRFFPGFYRHLPDTMRRIPFPDRGRAGQVDQNLVVCRRFAIAPGAHQPPLTLPTNLAGDWAGLIDMFKQGRQWGVKRTNLWFLLKQLAWLLSYPIDRRHGSFDSKSWFEFTHVDPIQTTDRKYNKYFVDGPTRALVAAKADRMNAFTAGTILCQLFRSMTQRNGQADRVLCGPTNEYWIVPWIDYLKSLGVTFRFETAAIDITCSTSAVDGVTVKLKGGIEQRETADWYVAAVPFEVMRGHLSQHVRLLDQQFDGLRDLKFEWMNGVQFYLDQPLNLVDGHVVFSDSQWALTTVEQQNHWSSGLLRRYGAGDVRGIISVDISDWDTPGFNGKKAKDCTDAEIYTEVLKQIRRHLDRVTAQRFDRLTFIHKFLDPDIGSTPGGGRTNAEPLLVNTVGSWAHRPQSRTAVPNLVLAADYVQTHTDLACMEGANEAARRAVNVILDEEHSRQDRCGVWPLEEFQGLFGRLEQRRNDNRPYDSGRAAVPLARPGTRAIKAPNRIEEDLWKF